MADGKGSAGEPDAHLRKLAQGNLKVPDPSTGQGSRPRAQIVKRCDPRPNRTITPEESYMAGEALAPGKYRR
jgi:hypothetical protein